MSLVDKLTIEGVVSRLEVVLGEVILVFDKVLGTLREVDGVRQVVRFLRVAAISHIQVLLADRTQFTRFDLSHGLHNQTTNAVILI